MNTTNSDHLHMPQLLLGMMLISIGVPVPAFAQTKTWAERLGYPPGKRVVILHADDIGMCYEANQSAQRALSRGEYRSASAMAPCAWFNEMAAWCVANPEHDVGLHLALTSEWRFYRWGPVAPREKVPGLVDPMGYLFRDVLSVARSAKADEVASEIRAQLARARQLGMQPSHIDTHMGTLYARPDFTRAYLKLAMDEGIPAMVIEMTPRTIEKFRAQGYPMSAETMKLHDAYTLPKLDNFHSVPSGKTYEEKRSKLLEQLRLFQPGLHEIIYHPSVETEGLKKITNSWQQRVWEDRLFADPVVQRAIKDNDIIVTDWKEVMKRFKKRPPSPNATERAHAAEVLAFPGAEGFGRFAKGGRGGDVYHVVNLNDAGPGSLREGIRSAQGPRTIVFAVSGTIELKSRLIIDRSYLTIAGQTAPGDGICLKDHSFQIKKASHIIVRYLRIRLGDKNKKRPAGFDAMTTDDVDHVIFDHITSSWGIDGNHDLRRGGNFTLQWSIYGEALHDSLHEKGPHAMLASFRDLTAGISLHHNLFASSRDRHPTLGGSPRTDPNAIADFRNNVVYNVAGATNLGNCRINVINNYYRPGPNTPGGGKPIATKAENKDATKVFLAGNFFEGNSPFTEDNYRAIDFERMAKGNYLHLSLEKVKADAEFDVGGAKPRTESAAEAYEAVLRDAGASRRRDAADERLVQGVRRRTHRMINSQGEIGGWPALKSEPARLDTDRDGMPDDWERANGLNPANPDDGNQSQIGKPYTNLEAYLNSLCVSPTLAK